MISKMIAETGRVLVSSHDIQEKVRELGERITGDYREDKLLLVGILRGAVVFLSDLMRHRSCRARSTSWRSAPTARVLRVAVWSAY